jgi:hypothetical protein
MGTHFGSHYASTASLMHFSNHEACTVVLGSTYGVFVDDIDPNTFHVSQRSCMTEMKATDEIEAGGLESETSSKVWSGLLLEPSRDHLSLILFQCIGTQFRLRL